MHITIPADFGPFVAQLIAEGRVRNEGEAVTEGLKLLQAREQLRRDVQVGIDSSIGAKG